MDSVLFNVDDVRVIESQNLKPNVVDKYLTASDSFRRNSTYSSLAGCDRCGISGYVARISDSLETIGKELQAIDQYVVSAISNYSALESMIQEKSSSDMIDSESLSGCMSTIVEISKFTRKYKSEDSRAHLEYRPLYTLFTSTSSVSGKNSRQMTYGNSYSKYISTDNSGYSVSSAFRKNIDYVDEKNDYSIDISDFIDNFKTTSSRSTINFQTSSNYQQGESTK